MKINFPLPYLSWWIISFSVLVSCSKTDENKLLNYFTELNAARYLSKDKEYVLVIPTTGCEYCIDYSLTMVSKYINKKNMLYVMVGKDGNKKLKLDVEKYAIDYKNPNCILDGKDILRNNFPEIDKPTLWYIKEGTIVNTIYLSPDNLEKELKAIGLH